MSKKNHYFPKPRFSISAILQSGRLDLEPCRHHNILNFQNSCKFLSQLVIAEIGFQISILWTNFCACYVLSHVQLFVTSWTVACQAPLSMEFSRQKYWSELPCPSPGDLPEPGIESVSLMSWQAGSLPLATPGKPT